MVKKVENDLKYKLNAFIKDFGDKEDNMKRSLAQIGQFEDKIENVKKVIDVTLKLSIEDLSKEITSQSIQITNE